MRHELDVRTNVSPKVNDVLATHSRAPKSMTEVYLRASRVISSKSSVVLRSLTLRVLSPMARTACKATATNVTSPKTHELSATASKDVDLKNISDPKQRKKIQNRIAQRNYRK